MNKKFVVVTLLAIAVVLTAGFYFTSASNNSGSAKLLTYVRAASDVYTCPMHPDITSDKAGQCPKCGMDLVLKTDDKKDMKMDCCADKDKCKEMGCSMKDCKGTASGCSKCSSEKHDCMMNGHDCSKSGCMKHN